MLISTSLSSLICSWLASRCSQRSPSQQRFPWALQLKEQILNEQITNNRVFFKMLFRPCPSGCSRFLSADDGHDRCLHCLGFQHAEDAFVHDFTAISPFLSERIGTLCRHPCSVLWLEQRTTGWRSGRSEGDSKRLSAGHAPTDLLLLTQRTSHPVPG